MSEVKYTPGPWSINQWTQPDREISIGAVGTPLIAKVMQRDVSINEQKANVRLIEQAPVLLDTLEKLEDIISAIEAHYDSGRTPSDMEVFEMRAAWQKAQAVIFQAKGL